MPIDPRVALTPAQMADLVVACFGWPREEVETRLRRELACSGWNVVTDVIERGVPPFVWSDAMGAFYATTRAFIYELLIYNAQPERLLLRERLLRIVAAEQARAAGRPVSVLLWGDGLGFDALAVAQAFPQAAVTYFEISDLSPAFAAHLFARAGVGHIRMARALEPGDTGRHDVVAAMDVMEHVPDPSGWTHEVAAVLRPGGVAVIKEAFDAVIASRPTHLRASAWRYAYRTPRLFEDAGFVTERYGNFPFVFRLGGGTPAPLGARLYYHLTTPVKRARILPRLLRPQDPAAFLARCQR
jgi:SAM-dependent methyltransferase